MLDEFLIRELDAGRIRTDAIGNMGRTVHLHGHCQQKALASLTPTVRLLEGLCGDDVRVIPSGCCGMAGSFGYEAEHFDLSQKIGELILFPRARSTPGNEFLCAPGTSCRHQIHDATGRRAYHPAELLRVAVVPEQL